MWPTRRNHRIQTTRPPRTKKKKKTPYEATETEKRALSHVSNNLCSSRNPPRISIHHGLHSVHKTTRVAEKEILDQNTFRACWRVECTSTFENCLIADTEMFTRTIKVDSFLNISARTNLIFVHEDHTAVPRWGQEIALPSRSPDGRFQRCV